MSFQDETLECVEKVCPSGGKFIFTAGEQEFFEKKGFAEKPKRCKPCREAKKARMEGIMSDKPLNAPPPDYRAKAGRGGRGRRDYDE